MIAACITIGTPGAAPSPYGPPVADFLPSDETINPFQTVSFVDISTDGPTTWSWEINGAQFAITPNASYFFAYTGDYVIRLTVSNSYGSDYIEHTISVVGGPVIP